MRTLRALLIPVAVLAAAGTASAQDQAQSQARNRTVAMQSLSLDAARQILAEARKEADRNGWPSTIAVSDAGGELLLLERMEGARPAGAYLAPGKARTAVIFRHPTKALEETINGGRTAQVTAPGFVQMEGDKLTLPMTEQQVSALHKWEDNDNDFAEVDDDLTLSQVQGSQ